MSRLARRGGGVNDDTREIDRSIVIVFVARLPPSRFESRLAHQSAEAPRENDARAISSVSPIAASETQKNVTFTLLDTDSKRFFL